MPLTWPKKRLQQHQGQPYHQPNYSRDLGITGCPAQEHIFLRSHQGLCTRDPSAFYSLPWPWTLIIGSRSIFIQMRFSDGYGHLSLSHNTWKSEQADDAAQQDPVSWKKHTKTKANSLWLCLSYSMCSSVRVAHISLPNPLPTSCAKKHVSCTQGEDISNGSAPYSYTA